ncbi:MAG: ATP/GTP-binding protein [Candidatus Hadarchaeales archaeon]
MECMPPLNIVLLGTAGAGKSALTACFGRWMAENMGREVRFINLDPGCEFTPFTPHFDIREHFTVDRIMREEGLGPNGAMVRASELLKQNVSEISRGINRVGGDIRLLDTPGQMEVFLFHGGPEMTRLIEGTTISLFLTDAEVCRSAAGFVFTGLLGLSIGLRLGVPTISVLNKVDLIGDAVNDIDRMASDESFLRKRAEEEIKGAMADLAIDIAGILPRLLPAARLVKTSAKTGEGMRELYDIVHEVFCACGDLT